MSCFQHGRVLTNTNQSLDEGELVRRLRAGDEEAFADLVRTYTEPLSCVTQMFFGNSLESVEAVSDVFVAVHRSIDSFNGHAKLGTWLHRIAINCCLMRLRSRRRARQVSFETQPLAMLEAAFANQRATELSGEERLSQAESIAIVRATIAKLPPIYQAVIQLRDLEELDTAETAARLGTNEPVVKTRLHRARLALRALLLPSLTFLNGIAWT